MNVRPARSPLNKQRIAGGAVRTVILSLLAALVLLGVDQAALTSFPVSYAAGDADGDGVPDITETNCGSDPTNGVSTPERADGIFAGADEDGDTLVDEALPPPAAASDCDGDGFKGAAEAGMPLCGNGVNDDGFITGGGSDDGVVDDGCPGGPAQVGAYSEGQFNIGLGDQDGCGANGWPAELAGNNDRVTLQDVTSFVAPPPKKLNTSPGGPGFNSRWDLTPGGSGGNWIVLQDLTALVAGPTAYPPMFGGAKAFNGPTCNELPLSRQIFTAQQEPARNPVSAGGVLLHSGAAQFTEVDLVVPSRGFDFVLSRTYRSDVIHRSPLGYNWDHNYFRRLVPGANGDVVRLDGMGRADTYDEQTGTYVAPKGFYTRLVKNLDESFTERFPDGMRIEYAPYDARGVARMTEMADRQGNTMGFTYDSVGRLTTVTDTLGRTYTYAYDVEQRLTSVTDFDGRAVQYTYDANGDLRSTRSPVVSGTPNGNNFPVGKTSQYTYSSGFSEPSLNHNLLTITAPNEVADASLTPRVVNTYGTTPATVEFDRVVSSTVGGTNAGGIPAGGTINYAYAPSGCSAPADTCVTDRNGNIAEYELDADGHPEVIRELTNRNINPSDPSFFETTFTYNTDGEVLTLDFPEGNRAELTYDSSNTDRQQHGNLVQVRELPDAGRGGDQVELVTTYEYEPMYNLRRTITDPRGNDTSYVPQNGGAQSGARYTTTLTFDYEEGCDYTALGGQVGRTPSEAQTLLVAAGMCASALGDLNGDSLTTQVSGNAILIDRPDVNLLAGSNQATVEGSTVQPIQERYVYDAFGQPTEHRDPEANVTGYTYYPENDPDGDGLDIITTNDPTTGGYLKLSNVDTTSNSLRNSGTNPTPTELRTEYFYDSYGNMVRTVNGRGVATDYSVNALNQVVQVTQSAANGLLTSIDPPEVSSLTDFQYLQRFEYDANDNIVRIQVEDRGNTSGVGGDNTASGTAFIDTVYEYDILDRRTLVSREVSDSEDLVTRYRYDANENPVLVIDPTANLPVIDPDYQPSNARSLVYDERDLVFTATRGGTTSQFDGLTAHSAIPEVPFADSPDISTFTYDYDGNRNLVRMTDAEDTDGIGGPEETLQLYDGYDRLVSTVDPVGNQSFYEYDPVSSVSSVRAFGPVGGTTPTSNGAATLTQPLAPGSFSQPLLLHHEYFYDEMVRLFQVDHELYVCDGSSANCSGVTFTRTPVLIDGPLGGTNDGLVTTRYEYDRNGRMTFAVEDDTGTGRTLYDGYDRPIKSIDRESNEVEFAYDDSSNLIEVRKLDVAQPLVPPTPAEVFLTTYEYDSLDRMIRATDNLGLSSTQTYDSRDNVAQTADAQGPVTGATIVRRAFAPGGLTVNSINDSGNTVSYSYDGLDRRVATVADLRIGGIGGNPIDTTNPANPDGRIVSDFEYDANSRTAATADDGSTSGDQNTSIGVIEPSSALGNVTRVEYDELDRPILEQYDDATTRSFDYDRDDNIVQMTDQVGNVFDYTYDGIDRPVRIDVTRNTGAGVIGTDLVTREYDGLGRVTSTIDNNEPADPLDDSLVTFAYDSRSRLLEERQQLGPAAASVVSSRWGGDDNRLVLIYPDNRQIEYTYDALDRVASVRDAAEPQPFAEYDYIGPDRLLERRYKDPVSGNPQVRLTYRNPITGADVGYDGDARPVLMQHLTSTNNPVTVYEYSYNRMHRLLREGRLHANLETTYEYDSMYRLTLYQRDATISPPGPPATTVNYQLDGNGNWAGQGTPNNMNEYLLFNGQPQQYDNSGNLKNDGQIAYGYDALNRLVHVNRNVPLQTISTYKYDALGRDVSQAIVNTPPIDNNTTFAYDGASLIQENKAPGGLQQYVGKGGTRMKGDFSRGHTRMDKQSTPGQPLFYGEDGSGNTGVLTNLLQQAVERYTYDAYGVPRIEDQFNNPVPGALQSQQGNPFLLRRHVLERRHSAVR